MPLFVGLDWGGASHAVRVVDAAGRTMAGFEAGHDVPGLSDLLARLERLRQAAELPVAIERPSRLVVDALVEAGHPVVPIHPNVLKACHPRYHAAGARSDPGDASMLADILRTDGHRFRPLARCSDEVRALRARVRARDDRLAQRLALANRLRALLDGFWPGAAAILAAIDSPIALAVIARYPTPEAAARLGEKRLASFWAQNAYGGRRSPARRLTRRRAAPAGLAGEAEADAKGESARALAGVLERLVTEIARLTSRIEHAVAGLADGKIIMSFPRAGRLCAAPILAEPGEVRERFPTEDQRAAEAGVAPVTHASGKVRSGMLRTGVVFRWACSKSLRAAVPCFADHARHASPWAAAVYAGARQRGCRHPHAVRLLARAWVRVLGRAWQDATPYVPAKHGSPAKLAA